MACSAEHLVSTQKLLPLRESRSGWMVGKLAVVLVIPLRLGPRVRQPRPRTLSKRRSLAKDISLSYLKLMQVCLHCIRPTMHSRKHADTQAISWFWVYYVQHVTPPPLALALTAEAEMSSTPSKSATWALSC